MQNTLVYNAFMARMGDKPPDDARWESQLRKGSLDLAILAVLWERPSYGLEIIRQLQARASVDLAEGTLYPILLRLTQDKLLESEWVGADSGHQRKYYRLSEAGRRRTIEMTQAWDNFSLAMSRLVEPIKEATHDRKRGTLQLKVGKHG